MDQAGSKLTQTYKPYLGFVGHLSYFITVIKGNVCGSTLGRKPSPTTQRNVLNKSDLIKGKAATTGRLKHTHLTDGEGTGRWA